MLGYVLHNLFMFARYDAFQSILKPLVGFMFCYFSFYPMAWKLYLCLYSWST